MMADMRLRLAVLMSLLAGLGLVFVFVFAGGVPSTADGSTTEGTAGAREPREPRESGASGVTTESVETSGLVGRRLTGLAETLVEKLSQGPRQPTFDQDQAAVKIAELFNDFDLDAAAAIYEKPSVGMEEWFLWLRARLGECGNGEPMNVVDARRARYIYTCERGRLEAQFDINPDTGKIPGVIMGARDVPIEDAVREAAETVMKLYERWDPELFKNTFNDKFIAEETRKFLLDERSKYGACSLGEPDLVSARGTLIHLECERGRRLMKVELDQKDDRIRILWIRQPRANR